MNLIQAKERLAQFLGETVLTFSIKKYEDGEWVAECNEIPAIMTGGMGDDITQMDDMIRDAILTAAGIDPEYRDQVLKFVGLQGCTGKVCHQLLRVIRE
jgi:predicted RNase H-like HicB family nuclease